MGIKLDISNVLTNLSKTDTKAQMAFDMVASDIASDFEAKAKQEAPWTDRTGMARKSLNGYVTHPSKTKIHVNLAHGVDYGIWLEMAHEKRFAIVEPIVRLNSPDALDRFNKVLDRISKI